MYNESSKKATIKYQKAHLAQINVRVPKEDKERYIAAAEASGKSFAAFLKEALDAKIKAGA